MNRHTSWLVAIVLVTAFIVLQVMSSDYGTRINDLPHIADYVIKADVAKDSALERDNIVGEGASESLDRWMMRFKLYSIEADEHLSVMALARIKPAQGQFDPHFYQYGGAWLYPLGAWYLALSKIGIISVVPLETLLANPDKMDVIYYWGRLFVVLSVSLAAMVLFSTALSITTPVSALLVMIIFMSAPATIMFSQVMKPHWYALLWVNISLFGIVRAWVNRRFGLHHQILVGVTLGLAVGSATTFSLFAIGVWFSVAAMVQRRWSPIAALALVPVIAGAVFLVTNPYLIFNYQAYAIESSYSSGWFTWQYTPMDIWQFLKNSFMPGFGVVFSAVLAVLIVMRLINGNNHYRTLALVFIGAVVFVAVMTSSIQEWHTNVRYLPWLLPASLLFLTASIWRCRTAVLIVILLAGIFQSAPLMLAYHDENSEQYATRLLAARWIDENIADAAALCFQTKTLTPYDAPPIDFARYRINDRDCNTLITVEREADAVRLHSGRQLSARFQPRYSPQLFPLVFSHINPQISIYRDE